MGGGYGKVGIEIVGWGWGGGVKPLGETSNPKVNYVDIDIKGL